MTLLNRIPRVQKDANRIYRLFCARNPNFAKNGHVSIIAHSLGSALTADILSSQPTFVKPLDEMMPDERNSETQFVFDTRVLILVGSPVCPFISLCWLLPQTYLKSSLQARLFPSPWTWSTHC